MFVIVDPVSSGISLSAAFAERGWPCWHLYRPELRDAWAADDSCRVLLHKSFDETLQVVSELAPRAVLPGSEHGVTLANDLAAALGLPHNETGLNAARRDRVAMARALEAADIAGPSTEFVNTERHLEALLAQPGAYPLVFRSSVTSEVTLCTNAQEARRTYDELVRQSADPNPGVLVQEYLGGAQYVVNTVSMAGEHLVTDVYAERVDEVNRKPVGRHIVLLRELDPAEQQAVNYVRLCLDAVGVREGPAHCRVRLTARGPSVIDVNPWLMGPILPADTYVSAVGYSQATVVAERYVDPMVFRSRLNGTYRPGRLVSRVPLRMHRSGIVRDMRGLDVIRRLPGFHSLAQVPPLGTRVRNAPLTAGAGGFAYFVHEDATVLRNSLEQVHEMEDHGRICLITARELAS